MTRILTYLCLVGLLIANTAQAQRAKIDSLLGSLKNANDTSKAYIYYFLGKNYLRVSNDSSAMYCNKAVEHAKRDNNEKMLAESLSVLGAIEKYKGNYEEALKYHLKALGIKERLKDEYGLAVTNNDLGILYKNMKRWNEALPYYRRSNELSKKIGLGHAVSFTYNNMGTIYNEIGHRDSAMMSYDSAMYYAEKTNNAGAMVVALANIADVYFADKKYDSALVMFEKCLYYDRQSGDKYGLALSHMQLGRTHNVLGNYKKALAHIDTADMLSEGEELLRERIDILTVRSSIEESLGDTKSAIKHIRAATALKDSLLNEETSKQISELQTKYETEKKEQQIALQNAELDKKNTIIYGVSGLLLLLVLLGYSYYRRYRLRQQDRLQKEIIKQQELATQAVIEAEERERKRIAGDLHDGVGQTMSAAKMNLSAISSDIPFKDEEQKLAFEKVMALVDEGCAEVRVVSHNIMPNALLKSGLATAVKEFLNKIDSKVLKVNLYTEGLNDRLPSNIETVLYRVVQECVNNVIKHAGANTLDITLIKDEDGISVTIEDNGKGFDIKEAKRKDGIGLQNLQTRINYLKGTIEWDSSVGNGTVVTIHVPDA